MDAAKDAKRRAREAYRQAMVGPTEERVRAVEQARRRRDASIAAARVECKATEREALAAYHAAMAPAREERRGAFLEAGSLVVHERD
jgi:hypothetical protein